ncbi:MAG: AEC family transporter [Clostridia bacterium]|nr:AEC family transporter [Clostridia bacterium]
MEILNLTISQMLMMFTLVIIGYILTKTKIIPDNADKTIAKIATFVFAPALNFRSLLSNCTVENFSRDYKLILYGLGFILVAILLSYLLCGLFVRKASGNPERAYKKNIYKYAIAIANFGFLGNFLVLEMFGDEMLYKYIMFTFFPTFFVYAWGLTILIPKKENASNGKFAFLKNLINPGVISVVAGCICGLLGLNKYMPGFLDKALVNLGNNCMGPAGMLLTGVVIGKYDIKTLWADKKVYIATVLRLLIIPALFALLTKAIGGGEELMIFTVMLFGTPFGLNTIVFPAAYGGETKTGAAMALISSILAIITMPLLYYIFLTLL